MKNGAFVKKKNGILSWAWTRCLAGSCRDVTSLVRLAMFALVAAVAAMSVLVWFTYDELRAHGDTEMRLHDLSGEISRLDEALTMTARLGAATGAESWRVRYDALEADLDRVLAEAQKLAPDAVTAKAASDVERANRALVDMERRALALAEQGRLKEAEELLYSTGYESYKELYGASLNGIRDALDMRLESALNSSRNRFLMAAITLMVVLPVMVLAWLGTMSTLRMYEAEKNLAEESFKRAMEESQKARALLSSSRSVLRGSDFKSTAREIFDECRKVTGATAGYVALLSQDGSENEVVFLESGGRACAVDPSLPMPIRGLRAAAIESGRVVYDNDFMKTEHAGFLPDAHVAVDNVMFAPLKVEGRVAGLLGLGNKEGGFDNHDAENAASFAEVAAMALVNSRNLEELDRSEKRYRAVLESAVDAIVTVDSVGRIVYWNDAAEKMFGYLAEEIVGSMLNIIMPEAYRLRHDAAMQKSIARGGLAGDGRNMEAEGLRKNGGRFPVEVSVATWSEGGGMYFTGVIRDITERKRAEAAFRRTHVELESKVAERTLMLSDMNIALEAEIEDRQRAEQALRESERSLQAIIDGVAEPIMIIDRDHNLRMLNRVAAGMSDRQFEEGLKCHELTHHSGVPCTGEGHPCPLTQVVETGEPVMVVHEHHVRDGVAYFEILASPLYGADGELAGIIETSRDITARKRMEDELKASLADKEMLLKEIHHRVKNNLMVIQSLLSLQSGKIADARTKEYFIESRNRVKSMSMIHERLYRSANLSTISFSEYIRSLAVQLFKNYAQVAERVRLDLDIAEAEMDIDMVIPCGLIVNELLSNAMKYAFPEDRKGRVLLGFRRHDDGKFELTVQDNGIGLPEGFDPARTDTLGIQIVVSLTRQIGGTLNISREGGSSFRVEFMDKAYKPKA